MAFNLVNFLKGVEAQINPFDGGQTYQSVQQIAPTFTPPPARAALPASTRPVAPAATTRPGFNLGSALTHLALGPVLSPMADMASHYIAPKVAPYAPGVARGIGNVAAGLVAPVIVGAGEVYNRDINAPIQATLQSGVQALQGKPVTWGQNYNDVANQGTQSLQEGAQLLDKATGLNTSGAVQSSYEHPGSTAVQTGLTVLGPAAKGLGIIGKGIFGGVGGYYGVQSAKQIPGEVKQVMQTHGADRAQAITEALGNTAVAILGTHAAVHGGIDVAKEAAPHVQALANGSKNAMVQLASNPTAMTILHTAAPEMAAAIARGDHAAAVAHAGTFIGYVAGPKGGRFDAMANDGKIQGNSYERSDAGMKINNKAVDQLNSGKSLPLNKVITHKELSRDYPDVMKNTKVQVNPSVASPVFDKASNTIHIPKTSSITDQFGRGSLMHEVQHAIDYHEGRPSGTNPHFEAQQLMTQEQQDASRIAASLEPQVKNLQQLKKNGQITPFEYETHPAVKGLRAAQKVLRTAPNARTRDAWVNYLDNPAEKRARATQERVNLSQKQIDANPQRLAKIKEQYGPEAAVAFEKFGPDEVINALAKEHADMLRSIEQDAKGGQMQPKFDGTTGYIRTSNHSQFYREYYKKFGKPPTKAAYLEEAHRQLRTGKDENAQLYQDAQQYKAELAKTAAKPAAKAATAKQEFVSRLTKQMGNKDAESVFKNAKFTTKKVASDKLNSRETPSPAIVKQWEAKIKAGERPSVLTHNGEVVDGNHRLQAYKNLGIKDVPVIEATTKQGKEVPLVMQPEYQAKYKTEREAKLAKVRADMARQAAAKAESKGTNTPAESKKANVAHSSTDKNGAAAGGNGNEGPVKPDMSRQGMAPEEAPSRFQRRVAADKRASEDLKASMMANGTHAILHNKDVVDAAVERVKKSEDDALAYAKRGKGVDANATALVLLEKFLNEKRYEAADELVQAVGPRFTKEGQAIQILKMYSRLTPAGAVRYAGKLLDRAAAESGKDVRATDMTRKAAQRLTDANKEAADQVAKELQAGKLGAAEAGGKKQLTPEERLAKRINVPGGKAVKADPIKDMVDTLYKVAKTTLPEAGKKLPKDPISLIGEAIRNKEQYKEVWNKAKSIVEDKYKDNPDALDQLNNYFEKELKQPYAQSQVNRSVQLELQRSGVDLGKLVREHYTKSIDANIDLTKALIEKAGLTEAQAGSLAADISRRFNELTAAKKQSILKQMFGEKALKTQKTAAQRIIEMSNLGAFDSTTLKPLVAKKLGLPTLTPELAKKISTMAEELQKLPENSDERALAAQRLMRTITDEIPRGKVDAAFGIWRAGLLTGPETVAKIATSHLVTTAELADKPVAAVVDKAVSAAPGKILNWLNRNNPEYTTHQRTATFNLKEDVAAAGKGFGKGAVAAGHHLKTGEDLPHTGGFTGDISNRSTRQTRFEDGVYRVHGSVYKPFFAAGYELERANQRRIAESMFGKDTNKVEQFLNDPAQVEKATKQAEYFAMQNLSEGGKVTQMIQHIKIGPIPVGMWIAPFSRIPAALGTKGIVDYTPIGLARGARALYDGIRYGKFDQRKFVESVSRSGIGGSAVVLTGAWLMANGRMTLQEPNDPKEKSMWTLQGKTRNSIYVGGQVTKNSDGTFNYLGGHWVTLNGTGPMGIGLGIGGAFNQALQSKQDVAQSTQVAIASGVKLLADQPYMKGITGPANAITDPKRFAAGYIQSSIGSFIPAGIQQIARGFDSKQRMAPKNLAETLMQGIPGVREHTAAQVDLYGKPVPGSNPSGSFLGGIAGTINPLYPNAARNSGDITTQELQRLYNLQGGQGPNVSNPKTIQGTPTTKLSNQQINDFMTNAGPGIKNALDNLIRLNPQYQNLTDAQKTQAINSAIDKVRSVTVLSPKTGYLPSGPVKGSVGDLLGGIVTYAKAFFTDPSSALTDMLNGQHIVKTAGGGLIVARASQQDTQAVIDSRGGSTQNGVPMQLDHVIPLELGGTNAVSNLSLIPQATDNANNAAENFLATQMNSGKINMKTAQQLIAQYKLGQLSGSQLFAKAGGTGTNIIPDTAAQVGVNNPAVVKNQTGADITTAANLGSLGTGKISVTKKGNASLSGSGSTATDPKTRYQQDLAQYQQDKKAGKLTDLQDMQAKTKLARESVQSGFNQDVLDFYNMSKQQQEAYFGVNRAKATDLYNQAKILDNLLLNQGLIQTSKYKKSLNTSGVKTAKSSGRKGRGGSGKVKVDFAKLLVHPKTASMSNGSALRKVLGLTRIKAKAVHK